MGGTGAPGAGLAISDETDSPLSGAISVPAWRSKPSWYLVATDDRMIPPPAQRSMAQRAESTMVETAGSHSVYVSKPKVVAELIARAAREAR